MNDQNASAIQTKPVAARVTAGNARLSRITRGLLASLGAALLLVSAPTLAGPAVAPTLGVAQQFGALGNSGVTGSAVGSGTTVNGDVGSGPTTYAISNFPPSSVSSPFVKHPNINGVVTQAQTDSNTAYLFMQGQVAGDTPLGDNLDIVGVLTPGLYSTGAGLLGATTLTLNDPTPDNSGIFVFNVASSLTMSVGSSVIGNANPCNIYWRVGSDATLNGTSFMGTVIADRSITVGGGNVLGRVLAGAVTGTGVVTMPTGSGNIIGGCSLNAPLVIGAALPTIRKSFSPATIAAGGTSTLTITLSNTSVDTADTITSLTDSLPSGMLIAATPNASTTCGGAVTAVAGTSTVSLGAGGTIPAATLATNTAGTCTVSVNVTSATLGSLVNTVAAGGLVTNNGSNAAPASATLTVAPLAVATGIPTLSEWAMIMLTALLAITGFVTMRRQAR